MHQLAIALSIAVGLAMVAVPSAHAAPVVTGFSVSIYATATRPVTMVFDGSGALFLGNSDNSASGAFITRVAPGGGVGSNSSYGPAIFDPDGLAIDRTGSVSGVAGALLVGGSGVSGGQGVITAIRPDQTAFSAVLGGLGSFRNPGHMAIDNSGRLIFSDTGDGVPGLMGVYTASGGVATQLFQEPGGVEPDALAIDAFNRIYSGASDGVVRLHDALGNLLDGAFASGLGAFPLLAFANGGAFGNALYALDGVDGTLWRLDGTGTRSLIGSGFATDSFDIQFGPDGALYVGQNGAGNVLRIAVDIPTGTVPEPGTFALLSLGLLAMGRTWKKKGDFSPVNAK